RPVGLLVDPAVSADSPTGDAEARVALGVQRTGPAQAVAIGRGLRLEALHRCHEADGRWGRGWRSSGPLDAGGDAHQAVPPLVSPPLGGAVWTWGLVGQDARMCRNL